MDAVWRFRVVRFDVQIEMTPQARGGESLSAKRARSVLDYISAVAARRWIRRGRRCRIFGRLGGFANVCHDALLILSGNARV